MSQHWGRRSLLWLVMDISFFWFWLWLCLTLQNETPLGDENSLSANSHSSWSQRWELGRLLSASLQLGAPFTHTAWGYKAAAFLSWTSVVLTGIHMRVCTQTPHTSTLYKITFTRTQYIKNYNFFILLLSSLDRLNSDFSGICWHYFYIQPVLLWLGILSFHFLNLCAAFSQ